MKITLATLPNATEQQVFDQVATHLATQGVQARNNNNLCCYRTDNGLMCAAGCLMDDKEYDPDMEKKGWAVLQRNGKVPDAHLYLIQDLQTVHDGYAPKYWRQALQHVADQRRLCDNVLDKLPFPQ